MLAAVAIYLDEVAVCPSSWWEYKLFRPVGLPLTFIHYINKGGESWLSVLKL